MNDTLRDVSALKQLMERLNKINATENVLTHGFAKLASQLEPLAELSPPRRPMAASTARLLPDLTHELASLRAQLVRVHDDHASAMTDALTLTSKIHTELEAVQRRS